MRSDLETQFHHKMRGLYDRSVKECNYRPTYFLQMVVEHGGFETARRLLHARKVSDGFTTLWENGRLDLSVEAVVLQEPWSDLFTDKELAIAEKRLRDLGYLIFGDLPDGWTVSGACAQGKVAVQGLAPQVRDLEGLPLGPDIQPWFMLFLFTAPKISGCVVEHGRSIPLGDLRAMRFTGIRYTEIQGLPNRSLWPPTGTERRLLAPRPALCSRRAAFGPEAARRR